MTELVRGHRTGPSSIPRTWRGPLPDPSIHHEINTDGGYTKLPTTLLHMDGVPALGVIAWGVLRLRNDGRPGETNYRDLARDLHLSALSDSALEQRIGAAIKPLIGTWILRKKVSTRRYEYQAVIPDNQEGRYALLRRRDMDLLGLPPRGSRPQLEVPDLVNFCRWQLECGRRGWTANTLREIAGRWGVGLATASRHRDRLADLGLLEVVKRSDGRLSDLVWLKEIFDPHWELPTSPDAVGGASKSCSVEQGLGPDPCSISQGLAADSCSISQGQLAQPCSISDPDHVPYRRGPIRKLAESLTDDDLANLGGASASPLTSPTREQPDAPPAASRMEDDSTGMSGTDVRQVSARLVNRHPAFAQAKPHFRRAMIARLAAALERGLAPGHADRALARVAEEGAFDAECLLLHRALQQARADQLAGMCADCGGDRGDHRRGCAQFVAPWDRTAADDPGVDPGDPSDPGDVDPLTILLRAPVLDGGPEPADDASLVEWLIAEMAQRLVDVSDREARLRAIAVGLRAKAPPQQRELVDRAAEHVRYALTRAS